MVEQNSLPAVFEGGIGQYLSEIRKFPMLEAEEEYILARAWVNEKDSKAAHKLVTSHLRLVAKIALGYRNYGLPLNEIISEGNIGLMQAVKRFDPEKGFRLATYAIWWIRASIQEYILRSWSLVKIGTTTAQKKLFFNLRKIKSQIHAYEDGDLRPEQVKIIADKLSVTEDEVIDMNRRISSSDSSLNVASSDDSTTEWQDFLTNDDLDQEKALAEKQETEYRNALLRRALIMLKDRERDILIQRRLQEVPATLEFLSEKYNISKERVRQIENRAFEKLQSLMIEYVQKPALLQLTAK